MILPSRLKARDPYETAIIDHDGSAIKASWLAYTILTEVAPTEDVAVVRSRLDAAVEEVRIAASMKGSFIGSAEIYNKPLIETFMDHFQDNRKKRNFGFLGLI
jgi:hypothetical protein